MQDPSPEEFAHLYTLHQPRIFGYILSLVPDYQAAEDIAQETNTVLWRKFSSFEKGSNFFAWSCKIARYEISHYRRSQSRDRLRFDDAFMDAIAQETDAMAEELASRQRLLNHCVHKLRTVDQDLIYLKYSEGLKAKDISNRVGRTVDAVYKALDRVRRSLIGCVNQSLIELESESGGVT